MVILYYKGVITISKKITIISITLMLFISLVPSVSASNIEPKVVELQNSVKALIVNDQKIKEPKNSTGQHIKRQIENKVRFNTSKIQNRKFDRLEQSKKQLRMKRYIQAKKKNSKIKAYRYNTNNFKTKARKEINRNVKHSQHFNQ